MGGKGQRRRQKNFISSHGGNDRLPPPPNPADVDAIPSKLRRLMELQNDTPPHSQGGCSSNRFGDNRKRRGGADGKDKRSASSVHVSKMNHGGNDNEIKGEVIEKKKKRKRKAITDPQIQKLIFGGEHLTKRQRKKEYLDARKKKHKKPMDDSIKEFPGHENVRFGEVVDAPPKLTIPKALKVPKDASKERLRLQAVEAYRNRKSWASRPGINLPSVETPSIR